jgi:hypothetical protein
LEAIEAQIKEDDLINRKKKTGNGPLRWSARRGGTRRGSELSEACRTPVGCTGSRLSSRGGAPLRRAMCRVRAAPPGDGYHWAAGSARMLSYWTELCCCGLGHRRSSDQSANDIILCRHRSHSARPTCARPNLLWLWASPAAVLS